MINDAHCHFFSTPFFAPLGGDAALAKLGWDAPGTAEALADRWVAELDRHQVSRARADRERARRRGVGRRRRQPSSRALRRLLHGGSDAAGRGARPRRRRSRRGGLRGDLPVPRHAPLLDSGRPREARCSTSRRRRPGTAVFVHCGVLSVGVRKKLGLPSPFDIRFGNPLDLHARRAARHPSGADHHPALRRRPVPRGADGRRPLPQRAARHVELERLDQVSSGLTLADVFRQALAVVGPDRSAVRHRLVVLPARLGARRPRTAVGRARRDRREHRGVREDLRGQLRSAVSKSPECRLSGAALADLKLRQPCSVLKSVRDRFQVFSQQVSPEVPVEIAPHRVDVVAVVLRVVVLDEERRALHPVVVLLAALGLAGPRERRSSRRRPSAPAPGDPRRCRPPSCRCRRRAASSAGRAAARSSRRRRGPTATAG